MKRIYVSTMVSAAAGLAALGLIAGCGSGSGSTPAAAGASSPAGNSGFAAYTQCLSQHGVSVPSGFGGRRSHSPGAGFTRPAGGYPGFGGNPGALASSNPTMAAAMQACSSLRPTGRAGGFGGFGGGSSRLTAFRNCMTQQGEPVPTTRPTAFPTARPTGAARYLNGLNPSDPKVAAAVTVCQPLIPTGAPGGPGGFGAPTATPTTAG